MTPSNVLFYLTYSLNLKDIQFTIIRNQKGLHRQPEWIFKLKTCHVMKQLFQEMIQPLQKEILSLQT